MSDIICSKCKCLVGRHKLENGQCINVDRCMEMVKYEQKNIIQNHNIVARLSQFQQIYKNIPKYSKFQQTN